MSSDFVPEKWLSLRIDGWKNLEVKSTFSFYRSKILRTKLDRVLKEQLKIALGKANCLTIEIIPWDKFDNEEEDA